jgi:hypothetical protein
MRDRSAEMKSCLAGHGSALSGSRIMSHPTPIREPAIWASGCLYGIRREQARAGTGGPDLVAKARGRPGPAFLPGAH